jgi:hypothetical protein
MNQFLFGSAANVFEIFSALEVYRQIAPNEVTPLMNAFLMRFGLSHSEYFAGGSTSLSFRAMKTRLLSLSKRDFLAEVMSRPA